MFGVTCLHFTDSQTFETVIYMKVLRYISLLALLTILPVLAFGQEKGGSPERIKRMVESMPYKDIPLQGQFSCSELSNTAMFYTESDNGAIVQLGVRLFSDGIRKAYDPVIISFVERLWAELLLRKTVQGQSSLLKEYGVRIVLGGYPLGSGSFKKLSQAVDLINSMNSLTITTGGTEIDMFMRNAKGETLHIYIPASRDLLFQYDKKEHEELLVRELKESRDSYKTTVPSATNLTATDNGLLASGGDCYMIDSLKNDVFFTKSRTVVFDAAFPEESMRNLLMGAVNQSKLEGRTLDIRLHTYNKDLKDLKVSMSTFLGYIQKQGFRLYTGSLGRNGEKCQCLLAMYHPVYNYLHILSLSFTPQQLESKQAVTLQADLSTFIPQHNIKNLFQEK